MRNKFIKGKPVYFYKGRMYMEQPDKTNITKIVYDEVNNRSNVYCRKPTIFIEILSLIVMLVCVYINIITGWGTDVVSIKYNSSPIYYDNKLYINLMVEESISDVKYRILSGDELLYENVIHSGELHTTVNIPYSLKYKLEVITNSILGTEVVEVYDISSKLKEY